MKKQKKEKKRKNEIHHSNRFGTFPTNKTITRESLIPRRIPSFCNYFSITTECNQLQHETLILLFLLMHMTEKIVKTHFTSNILRHTGDVCDNGLSYRVMTWSLIESFSIDYGVEKKSSQMEGQRNTFPCMIRR